MSTMPQQGAPAPKPKKPWYKKWWVWLLVVVVIAAIVGGQGSKGGSATQTTAQPASSSTSTAAQAAPATSVAPAVTAAAPAAKDRLTLDDGWKMDNSNQFMTQVTGTVSNNSDKPVNTYVQITFDALDASGANVGTCLANTNTIDANGTWKFKAGCSGEGITKVRFKELSGF